MSDILIKNMKMPENCLHCGFSHMASDCLKIWIICKPKDISVADGDAVKDGRPDWCPLVEVPSADVAEARHGKWIEQEDGFGDTYYDCSCCGESFCLIEGTPADNMYNFCPNCGAKMDGE